MIGSSGASYRIVGGGPDSTWRCALQHGRPLDRCFRLCLTDRMHQSLTSNSHKRAECKQHLTNLVKSLTHDRTTIMESLNARMAKCSPYSTPLRVLLVPMQSLCVRAETLLLYSCTTNTHCRACRHLSTICTASAEHAMTFYHRLVHWENSKIIERQMKALQAALRPGQVIKIDDVFKCAYYACSNPACGSPHHCASDCPMSMD